MSDLPFPVFHSGTQSNDAGTVVPRPAKRLRLDRLPASKAEIREALRKIYDKAGDDPPTSIELGISSSLKCCMFDGAGFGKSWMRRSSLANGVSRARNRSALPESSRQLFYPKHEAPSRGDGT
jgi:hypothetical protein